MKKLVMLMTGCVFVVCAIAQDYEKKGQAQSVKQYCARLKDGKMVVMADNVEMKADIIFPNGNRLKTDGALVKKDGTTEMLENGECVNASGNIMPKAERKEKSKDMYEK